MLDHPPDRPSDRPTDRPTDRTSDLDEGILFAEDIDPAHDAPEDNQPSSGGGMLGRFRAGVSDPNGRPPHVPPFWRRFIVFLLKAVSVLIVGFGFLSSVAVFVIGWTGPPPTFTMASRAMNGTDVQKQWVPLKDISPHLVRAVIAAEDQLFCTHEGFDLKEIRKAMDAAQRGRNLRGASTITQQTAKNVYLFNGGGFARKGVEAWFTVLTEAMWSKPRIMETYLNVAEWGDGLFGIEAASQARFGVSAKNLTSRQAATLAAVLPSPNRWKVDSSYVQSRAGDVQTLMRVVRRDGLDTCVIR